MNAPSTSQLPSFSCKLCRQSSAGAGSTTVSPGGYIDAYSTSVSVLLVETEASEACCIGHDRAAMALLETEVWSIIFLCGSLVHEARGPTKEVKALCLNIRPSDQLDDPGLTVVDEQSQLIQTVQSSTTLRKQKLCLPYPGIPIPKVPNCNLLMSNLSGLVNAC